MTGGMGDGLVPGGDPPEQGSIGERFAPDPETDPRARTVQARLLVLTLAVAAVAVVAVAVAYLIG